MVAGSLEKPGLSGGFGDRVGSWRQLPELEDDLAGAAESEFFARELLNHGGITLYPGDLRFEFAGFGELGAKVFLELESDAVLNGLFPKKGQAGHDAEQNNEYGDKQGDQTRHSVGNYL